MSAPGELTLTSAYPTTSTLTQFNGASTDSEKGFTPTVTDVEDAASDTPRLPVPPFLMSFVFLVICFIFFMPYCLLALLLVLFALIELLVRKSVSSERIALDRLVFAQLNERCRRGVWKMAGALTPARASGALRDFLLPSLYIQDSALHQKYVDEGAATLKGIDREIKYCRGLVQVAREQRRQDMEVLDPSPGQIGEYCSRITESERLKRHLAALLADREEITFLAKTQAAADYTGYHGLADWAETALERRRHLMNALSSISFVGAGLTFTTVFSAFRGNIGLMCYAFGLFNCGFIVPMAALSLLKWAAARPRDTLFASPQIWSLILSAFVYLSVLAVGGAVCLLNVAIIVLHYSPPNSDAPLQFDVGPIPAGAFALVCAATTCVLTAFALVLHYSVNGWNNLLGALLGRQSEREVRGQQLHEYVPE